MLSEDQIIEELYAKQSFIGPEDLDDCSYTKISEDVYQLISKDLLVEGTHFRRDWTSAKDLGRKTLMVNLSDIAAMGGVPQAAYLGLSLPRDIHHSWVKEFFDGLLSVAKAYHVPIKGGDTTASAQDIFISLTIIGSVHPSHLKLRKGANPNDILCICGEIGSSYAGLKILESSGQNLTSIQRKLIEKHLVPRAMVLEGQWLGKQGQVKAMMDLSDGLSTDLVKLGKKSEVGFEVDLKTLPLSNEVFIQAQEWGMEPWSLGVHGGEDYALLFTCDPESFKPLKQAFEKEFPSTPLTAIGEIKEKTINHWHIEGKEIIPESKTFQHFS